MDLRQLDREIELNCGNASGSVKLLLRSLLRKRRGFKIKEGQAGRQQDSGFLVKLGIAEVRDGRLILHPNIQ